jgi:preprotein translocase subunit YajC
LADEAPQVPIVPAAPAGASPGGTQIGVDPPKLQPENPLPGLIITFLPLLIIFYLFFLRPESKRRKEKEALLSSLKPKDKVMTVLGLYGQIVEIDGDDVVLLVDAKKDVRLRFARSAIDRVVPDERK